MVFPPREYVAWRTRPPSYDFVDRNEDLQELLRKVSAPIKCTLNFLPLRSEEAAGA